MDSTQFSIKLRDILKQFAKAGEYKILSKDMDMLIVMTETEITMLVSSYMIEDTIKGPDELIKNEAIRG